MFQLTEPEFLLIGVLLVMPYWVRPRRAWQYASLRLFPAQARVGFTTWLITALMGSAFLLLLIALANPQNATVHRTETVQARDIVLTLDLSLILKYGQPSLIRRAVGTAEQTRSDPEGGPDVCGAK